MGRFAETLDDDGNPTPITITGVQRRCAINTQPNPEIGCPEGIYGRHRCLAIPAFDRDSPGFR